MIGIKFRFDSFCKRLLANRRGNVLFMSAAAIPAVLGSAGLGTDTVQWMMWKRQLQQAADSSALAGAYAIANSQDSWATFAQDDLAKNGDITPTVKSFTTPTSGPYAGNPKAVQTTLSFSKALPFSGMFISSAPLIRASSVAAVLASGVNCILALSTEVTTGIDGEGGSVNMGCGAAANSRGSSAILTDSSFIASPLTAVGAVSGTPPSGTDVYSYSVPQEDPFASIPPVTVPSPCNTQIKATGTYGPVVAGGTLCVKMFKVNGGDTVTLQSGTYILNTDLVINGGGTLQTAPGAKVTLVLATDRNIKMNGNAVIKLTAPTSGTYKGVIIYQSRDSSESSSPMDNKITGDSGSYLEGAIYMPQQNVGFAGNAGVNSNCMQIVANEVQFSGNVNISNVCPSGSGASAFTGTVVRLVG